MFEQTFVQTQARTRKPWTVVVSLSLQCLTVVILLLLPLLHPETLRMPGPPQPHLIKVWIAQPPLPPPKMAPRAVVLSAPAGPRPFVYVPPNLRSAEIRSVEIPSADPALAGWSGPSTAMPGPAFMGATTLPPRVAAPTVSPVQTAPKAAASGPLNVGGEVEGARLVYSPHPAYPQIAKAARSQGVVRLEAMIAANGSIRNLRVVSGPPLLVAAALEAVRQWRYRPTLLDGVAVEVLTEIDINFTLEK